MGSMIPCYDCFSEDGTIDYGDFAPNQYPCCNCESRKYKSKRGTMGKSNMTKYETTKNTLYQLKRKIYIERWEEIQQLENEDCRYTIAVDEAIKAIKELEKYQFLGSPEELQEILSIISNGQEDTDEHGISEGMLNVLVEYAKYKKIGTIEECLVACEKTKIKRFNSIGLFARCYCPSCLERVAQNDKFCSRCGQSIEFSK